VTGSAQRVLDGLDLPALERFFTERVPRFSGHLSAELLHGGRSNLTYLLTDGKHRWVLRRPPLGGLTPSAHDMAREYRVIAALDGSGVPVAHAVALCDDTFLGVPFSVVDYVDGTVIRTTAQLHALPDAVIERCAYGLIDVLARLHAIEPAAVGLSGFGRPQGYLARQVRRWHDQWTRVRTRPLAEIDTLHAKLASACPAESGASIVHGDYRIDNCISSEEDTIAAVLDWEMATLGDPLTDVGLLLMYWRLHVEDVALPPGAPTGAELAEQYAGKRGLDLAELDWYLAFANYKLAVIAEGIHFRYQAGQTVGEGFADMGALVPRLIAQGHDALRGQ
jgi:aminoglycoside phosphotransferase (APT) family kinase protein